MSDSIFDVIDRRFMSGNSVSVERVHIKSDEWTDLKYELFAARKENERVRQASLDVMMHFGDTKATKDKLEADLDRALARVAELEEGLAGIENCAFGYQGCRQTAEEAADWMNAEATRLLEGTNGAHTLRKQAEAVEHQVKVERDHFDSYAPCLARMEQRAQRLRQQADQMESTHD